MSFLRNFLGKEHFYTVSQILDKFLDKCLNERLLSFKPKNIAE